MGHGKGSTRMGKGRFHPSRISGYQKFLRAKEANERAEKEKKTRPMIPVNLGEQDWSVKRN